MILFNLSNEEYTVGTGNLIGQLSIDRCYTPKFVEVMSLAKRKPKEDSGVLVLYVLNIVSFLFLAFELLIN